MVYVYMVTMGVWGAPCEKHGVIVFLDALLNRLHFDLLFHYKQ